MTLEPMHDYARAIALAAEAHQDQFRKGNRSPYILHPLRVAEELRRNGCRETVVVAGVLHDVVEDTPTTIGDIERSFGGEVASIVDELTKTPGMNRREYIESFADASLDACTIKAIDRIDNLSEGGLDTNFLHFYITESVRLLDTIESREDLQLVRGGALRLVFLPRLKAMLEGNT